MHMDMIHLLMPDPAVVDDGAEPVGGARLARETPGEAEHPAESRLVRGLRVVERRHVVLGNDQEVHRRLRPDVVESHHLGVLVDLLRRDLAARDLAKNAVGIVTARIVHFFLAAFSSSPEMPSRRCISASTSPGPRPCLASTIIEWNHRSAISCTICSRSPPFAASTASVASSPTFFSSASSG